MLELAAKEVDFHFNKKHLEDPSIPMWVVRAKGKSYYVNHVTADLPWSTKETPDNSHTKGTIKFKDVHLRIDQDNCAVLTALTAPVAARLRARERGYTRILITRRDTVVDFLESHGIKHTTFKRFSGGCGSVFHVCDIIDPGHVVMMQIALEQQTFRTLNENETYYQAYDDPSVLDEMDDDVDYDDVELDD
jgi:hypothetical protein